MNPSYLKNMRVLRLPIIHAYERRGKSGNRLRERCRGHGIYSYNSGENFVSF